MRAALVLLVAAALGVSLWLSTSPGAEPPAETPSRPSASSKPAPPNAVPLPGRSQPSPQLPHQYYRKYPPGSRVAIQLPAQTQGIPVGGGAYLPPLNGVRPTDDIPPISRDRRLPPPGPVVAKVVGPDGAEFWEHADGSLTTTRYANVENAEGAKLVVVSTEHGRLLDKSKRGKTGR